MLNAFMWPRKILTLVCLSTFMACLEAFYFHALSAVFVYAMTWGLSYGFFPFTEHGIFQARLLEWVAIY